MRRAVFLDRDGTINEERGYLDRLDRLELYPYAVDAVRLLNRAGFLTVVVTNQGGIGRGIIDAEAIAPALVGAIVKDPVQDRVVLQEYLETVLKSRAGWGDLYSALRDAV